MTSNHERPGFGRAIWNDVRHNPPLAVAAGALILWAYLGMSAVFAHYAETPAIGYVVGIGYEAGMVGLAWGARLRHEVKGVNHWAWTAATFLAALASGAFAAWYGYALHGEGFGAITRAVAPISAALFLHGLLLGSNGLRAAIDDVSDRARRVHLVSVMLDAAKAVKFAASADERRDRMGELHAAQAAVRTSGSADVVTLTETWCDRDAAIDTALRLVADRSASWLDDSAPQLLLPAGVTIGRDEPTVSVIAAGKPRVKVSAASAVAGERITQRVTPRTCAAPGCSNDISGKRADARTCSPSCRNALSLALKGEQS
jgi:hypothetical protein